MNKILVLMFCMIFIVGTISAFEFDNVKQFEKAQLKYGKIEIKNSILGIPTSKAAEIILEENSDYCGNYCYAKGTTILYDDGKIINDIRMRKFESGGWIEESNIKDLKVYIKEGTKLVDDPVYEHVCGQNYNDYNKTFYEVCATVITKINKKEVDNWIIYDNSIKEGNKDGITYEWRIEGTKEYYETYDWVGDFLGVEATEWANWTVPFNNNIGLVSFWRFNETSGTTMSDELNRFDFDMSVTNITTGAPGLGNAQWYSADTDATATGGQSLYAGVLSGTNYTIEFWFNSTNPSAGSVIMSMDNVNTASPLEIQYNPSAATTNMTFILGNGGSQTAFRSPTNLSVNEWIHIAFTKESNNYTMYVDGLAVKSEVIVQALAGTVGKELLIGERDDGQPTSQFVLDEFMIWNVTRTGEEILSDFNQTLDTGISITLDSPTDNAKFINTTIQFDASFSTVLNNLVNSTLFVWFSNATLFGTNSTTITGQSNISNLSLSNFQFQDNYDWSYFVCKDNNFCQFGSNNSLDVVTFLEGNNTFNAEVFETDSQTFTTNITTIPNVQSISANLNYNGTLSTATVSCVGTLCDLSSTIDIPLVTSPPTQNRSFLWEITINDGTGDAISNTSSAQQNTSEITFALCNSTLNIPYMNFTFKNETANMEDVDATIAASISHWLGSGAINKTLSFANTTENSQYGFCFSPPNEILNTDQEVAYNNDISQQRIFAQTAALSNTTTTQTLYLLPTSLGLFSQFRTEDSLGNTLSSVKAVISTTIGGTPITSAVDFTDSSGLVVFFLNPDRTYTGTFTRSGFNDNVFSFVPVTDLRTVIMASSAAGVTNGSNLSFGTSYEIKPTNGSLSNNTVHTFSFNVTTNETINLISMNITNSSGEQFLFVSNSGTGFISGTLNTGNNRSLVGNFIIQTSQETLTVSKLWIIGSEFEGDYSLHKQLRLFNDYSFRDFWRYLIVIGSIVAVLIFMSTNETVDSSESKVAVIVLLIWAWSVVGWLQNPSVVSETGLAQFSRQYGVAILSSVAGFIFIFRRVFRLITT